MSEITVESDHLPLAGHIVFAFFRNNPIPAGEPPALVSSAHAVLRKVASGSPEQLKEELDRPLQIKRSVGPDTSSGRKRHKFLKRHLSGRGLTLALTSKRGGLEK